MTDAGAGKARPITSAPEAAAAWRAGDREGCWNWISMEDWTAEQWEMAGALGICEETNSRAAQVALEFPSNCRAEQDAFLRYLADPEGGR